jgi:thiol-disulfide isomerase/thioredoxin
MISRPKRKICRAGAALAIVLALGGAGAARAGTPALYDYGPAPEFTAIETWLNSESLTMRGLAGKVVLIDFWTYSCINCLRFLPYVVTWYDRYRDKGLVVVGVHTPEFAFERRTQSVQSAMRRFGIRYPVAQDNRLPRGEPTTISTGRPST